MKYVLEFGVRGGAHTDNMIFPTRQLAEDMARKLVMVFENDTKANGATAREWLFDKHVKRMTWKNETHFVAVSKLDGVTRGPASAGLWRKPQGTELTLREVVAHYAESNLSDWG